MPVVWHAEVEGNRRDCGCMFASESRALLRTGCYVVRLVRLRGEARPLQCSASEWE